jgi:DNA polymerase-3 subunit alpha/error-prone DNA polymerase
VWAAAAGRQIDRPAFPPENPRDRLRRQFAALGFLCDRHPMVLFTEVLEKHGIVKAAELHRHAGKTVRTAGLLITGKVVSTKHGDPMEFLTFEDETGLVETTFFPEAYRRFCYLLDRHRPYVLTGKVDEDFGAVTLTVDRVAPLGLPS